MSNVKDNEIKIRISTEIKESFIKVCNENKITISKVLSDYIQKCIDNNIIC